MLYFGRPEEKSDKNYQLANEFCIYVGLKEQHLGYHNSWDCWYFILIVRFYILHCLDVGSATDGRWKLAATHCNTIKCHQCGMML